MGCMMLDYSMLPNREGSAWKKWIKYMMEDGGCNVSRAAIVKPRQKCTLAASKRFNIPPSDIELMTYAFEDSTVDRICLSGTTFIIRSRSPDGAYCLVAFSGNKYVVISASQTMYVVLVLDGVGREQRDRVDKAVAMARKLSAQLSHNEY